MENLNIFFFFLLPESQEIPDDSKHRPGHVEWGAEAEEGPGPWQLYRRGEEVLEEPVVLSSILGQADSVDSAVLSHGKTN